MADRLITTDVKTLIDALEAINNAREKIARLEAENEQLKARVADLKERRDG